MQEEYEGLVGGSVVGFRGGAWWWGLLWGWRRGRGWGWMSVSVLVWVLGFRMVDGDEGWLLGFIDRLRAEEGPED